MKGTTTIAALAMLVSLTTAAGVSAQGATRGRAVAVTPTDAQIRQAWSAVENADTYGEILDATQKHETTIAHPRAVALAEELLGNPALDGAQRGLIAFERQLSIDCVRLGPAPAARLLSVRIVTVSAMLANTPEQLAGVLGGFADFSAVITPQLVREALATPGSGWPPAIIPLMEQLAGDWPKYGALEAARRMAGTAAQASGGSATTAPSPQASAPPAAPVLPGHWRNTRIVLERPIDEHLVLGADGTAETWTVRASGRDPSTRGRWRAEGSTLIVDWEDGSRRNQPYTFYEGQLVLPNMPNQRQFWELLW